MLAINSTRSSGTKTTSNGIKTECLAHFSDYSFEHNILQHTWFTDNLFQHLDLPLFFSLFLTSLLLKDLIIFFCACQVFQTPKYIFHFENSEFNTRQKRNGFHSRCLRQNTVRFETLIFLNRELVLVANDWLGSSKNFKCVLTYVLLRYCIQQSIFEAKFLQDEKRNMYSDFRSPVSKQLHDGSVSTTRRSNQSIAVFSA